MFPLVSVWVRHEDPGNYTHIILLPKNYSLITKSGTSSNFEIRNIAFCLLVVSTLSTFSIITCVLPPTLWPQSWMFLFCYKITSGPVRTFQTSNYKFHVVTTDFILTFFQIVRRNWENHAYQILLPSRLQLLVTWISVKHTWHIYLDAHWLLHHQTFLETPFSLFSLVTRPHVYL